MNDPRDVLHIDHLHYTDSEALLALRCQEMLAETRALHAALEVARSEIVYLTDERDLLLGALRTWARPGSNGAGNMELVR